MKLNIKAIFIITLLLVASQISFSKEILKVANSLKFSKAKSNKNFNYKSSFKTNFSKKVKNSTNQRLDNPEWFDENLMLPVAFLKGICSEFESLKIIESLLDFILKPPDNINLDYVNNQISEFVCEKLTEDESPEQKSFEEKAKDTIINSTSKYVFEQLKMKEKFRKIRAKIFKDLNKESQTLNDAEQINLDSQNFCNMNESYRYQLEVRVFPIIEDLQEQDIRNSSFGKASIERVNDQILLTFGSVFYYHPKIRILVPDFRLELVSNHLKFAKEFMFKKFNEIAYKHNISFTINESPMVDKVHFLITNCSIKDVIYNCTDDYIYEVMFHEFIRLNEIRRQALFDLKEYFSRKYIFNNKCSNAPKDSFITMLFKFTYNFFLNIVDCIAVDFIKFIVNKGIRYLLESVLRLFLGWTISKTVWYVGKFAYYTLKALLGSNTKIENAEYYGKAVASLYKALISFIGMKKKRKFRKLFNKKMHKY